MQKVVAALIRLAVVLNDEKNPKSSVRVAVAPLLRARGLAHPAESARISAVERAELIFRPQRDSRIRSHTSIIKIDRRGPIVDLVPANPAPGEPAGSADEKHIAHSRTRITGHRGHATFAPRWHNQVFMRNRPSCSVNPQEQLRAARRGPGLER